MAHYVIVGAGRVGSRLAGALESGGHSVTMVDRDARAAEALPDGLEAGFVTGIGFDRDVLRQAGIEHAQGLAAVTADDNTNIIAARVARETFHVEHVVARIYDAERARVYQRLGVPTVASIQWTADQVLHRLLPAGAADAEHRDASGRLLITEFVPHSSWWGRRLVDVEKAAGVRVAYLTRFGEGVLPQRAERLQEGDVVHGVYPVDRREQVEAALQSAAREPDEDQEDVA